MKIMKFIRYPLLFLAVILIPIILAGAFLDAPAFLGIPDPYRWSFMFSIIGYLLGYLLISGLMRASNRILHNKIYSKRIRTTYLITNAISALILLAMLGYAVSLLLTNRPLTLTTAIIYIGFPWVSVQMLLLLFFVRSESLYK